MASRNLFANTNNFDDDDDDDDDSFPDYNDHHIGNEEDGEENPPPPLSVRVLVCSANIGNAKPNLESIHSWIPNNGFCKYALHQNPRYPLVLGPTTNNLQQQLQQSQEQEQQEQEQEQGATALTSPTSMDSMVEFQINPQDVDATTIATTTTRTPASASASVSASASNAIVTEEKDDSPPPPPPSDVTRPLTNRTPSLDVFFHDCVEEEPREGGENEGEGGENEGGENEEEELDPRRRRRKERRARRRNLKGELDISQSSAPSTTSITTKDVMAAEQLLKQQQTETDNDGEDLQQSRQSVQSFETTKTSYSNFVSADDHHHHHSTITTAAATTTTNTSTSTSNITTSSSPQLLQPNPNPNPNLQKPSLAYSESIESVNSVDEAFLQAKRQQIHQQLKNQLQPQQPHVNENNKELTKSSSSSPPPPPPTLSPPPTTQITNEQSELSSSSLPNTSLHLNNNDNIFSENNHDDDDDDESIHLEPLKGDQEDPNQRQFDIIVIGLQEATFNAEKDTTNTNTGSRFMSNRSGHSSYSYNFDDENSMAGGSFDDMSFFGNESLGSLDSGDGLYGDTTNTNTSERGMRPPARPPRNTGSTRSTGSSASNGGIGGELPPRRPLPTMSRKKSGDQLAAMRLASEPSHSLVVTNPSKSTAAPPSTIMTAHQSSPPSSPPKMMSLKMNAYNIVTNNHSGGSGGGVVVPPGSPTSSSGAHLPRSSPPQKVKKKNSLNMAIMKLAEEKANKRNPPTVIVSSTSSAPAVDQTSSIQPPSRTSGLPPSSTTTTSASSSYTPPPHPPHGIAPHDISSLSMRSTTSVDDEAEEHNTTPLPPKPNKPFSFRSRSRSRTRERGNEGHGDGDKKRKPPKPSSSFSSFGSRLRNRSASPAPRKMAPPTPTTDTTVENSEETQQGDGESSVGGPPKRTNSFSFRLRNRSASPAPRRTESSTDDTTNVEAETETESAKETPEPGLKRKNSFSLRLRNRSASPAPRKNNTSASSKSIALPPSRPTTAANNLEKESISLQPPKSSSFNFIPRIRTRSASPAPRGRSGRSASAGEIGGGGLPSSTSMDEMDNSSHSLRPPLANKSDKGALSFKTVSKALLVPTKMGYKAGKTAGSYVGKGAKVTSRATMAGAKSAMKASKAAKILTTEKDHTKLAKGFNPQSSLSHLMLDGGVPTMSDTAVLHDLFEDHLPGYRRALSYQRGEMRLLIYCRENSDMEVELLSVKAQATGRAGLANKGGIVAEVAVNKTTRLAFATAHLEAHEGHGKYLTRCSTIADILRGTESTVTSCRCDASLASHFMFFMGDLNFRTRLDGLEPASAEHIAATHEIVGSKAYIEEQMGKSEKEKSKEKEIVDKELEDIGKISQHSMEFDFGDEIAETPPPPPPSSYIKLNKADELAHALREKDCLVGFSTPYCNFPPTFKVARGPGYRYNGKRSPSYTDRILYKTADQLETALTPLLYEPVEDFTTSDHKPIRGAFDIQLNEKLQWRPVWKMMGSETAKPSRLPFFGGKQKNAPRANRPRPNLLAVKQMGNRECMHLFVSSIHCDINPRSYTKKGAQTSEMPSPFVCFVTTPSETVQKDATAWNTMWKKMGLQRGLKTTTEKVNTAVHDEEAAEGKNVILRTMMGWPRTKKLPPTFQPVWGEGDEVHFKVRTHRLDDGEPIDLSGAMLHIAVYDGRETNFEPRLLGSFTLNLAKMIVTSKNPNAHHDFETTSDAGSATIRREDGPSNALKGAVGKNIFPSSVLQAAKASLRQPKPSKLNPSSNMPKVSDHQSLSESSEMNSSGEDNEDDDKFDDDDDDDFTRSLDRIPKARFQTSTRGSIMMSGPSDNLREAMLTSTVFASKAQREVKAAFRRSLSARSLNQDSTSVRRLLSGNHLSTTAEEEEVAAPDEPTPSEGDASERSGPPRRQSLIMFGGRRNLLGDEFDQMNIVSLRLDEPLMKSGKEVGRISCGIDAWWMEDDEELTGKKG